MTKKEFRITGIGTIIGLIAGYLYFAKIGCFSGTCGITSKPINSSLCAGIMGGLLFNLLVSALKKKERL